jgi:hypothetical protein
MPNGWRSVVPAWSCAGVSSHDGFALIRVGQRPEQRFARPLFRGDMASARRRTLKESVSGMFSFQITQRAVCSQKHTSGFQPEVLACQKKPQDAEIPSHARTEDHSV